MGGKSGRLAMAVLLAVFLMANVPVAMAETQWQKDHPRREQVNKRLNNQDRRIKNKVDSGKMTKAQAAKLHREDRQIRGEERAMASQNGGHITKQEQRTLNQQENKVSSQIHNE